MTRDKILEAARALFEKNGFDVTTVREIAARAEVNVALINYHFGSKEALLAALIEEMGEATHIRLSDITRSDNDPETKLQQTVEVMVEKIFTNKNYYQMVQRELSMIQRPELHQKLLKSLKRNREEMRKIIEEGQQKKVFRKDIDMDLTVGTLFGVVYHLTNSRLKFNLPDNDEEAKQRVRDHVSDMLQRFLKK